MSSALLQTCRWQCFHTDVHHMSNIIQFIVVHGAILSDVIYHIPQYPYIYMYICLSVCDISSYHILLYQLCSITLHLQYTLHCITLHCTTLYYTILYSILLVCILVYIVLCCIVSYYIILYHVIDYVVLHIFILYYNKSYCIVLLNIVL